MDTSESVPLFDDSAPFVNEACGDTMWDDVLNQPSYTLEQHPPLPPFTLETGQQKVQLDEDAQNSRDTERVSLTNTQDTE